MDGSAAERKPKPKAAWAFMAEHMPKCVQLIKEARAKDGAHLDLCWRRGVVDLQPGWFWAYEGGVSVGVPDLAMLAEPNMQQLLVHNPGLALLNLHAKEQGNGA